MALLKLNSVIYKALIRPFLWLLSMLITICCDCASILMNDFPVVILYVFLCIYASGQALAYYGKQNNVLYALYYYNLFKYFTTSVNIVAMFCFFIPYVNVLNIFMCFWVYYLLSQDARFAGRILLAFRSFICTSRHLFCFMCFVFRTRLTT